MRLFDEVKQNVTVRQAAEMYGLKPNRSGLICCIFHNDKSPSMKVDRRYYCFGCGCTGDAIDFTAQLFGLGLKEAAQKLADDFGIVYADRIDGFKRKPISVKKPEPTPKEKWQSESISGLPEFAGGLEIAVCTEEPRGRMGQKVYDRIKGTYHSGILSGYSAVRRSGRERSSGL